MNELAVGTPVRILKHHHERYTGKVASIDKVTGFYNVRLTLTPEGEEIPCVRLSGLYARHELEPLNDHPHPDGSARDGDFSPEAA